MVQALTLTQTLILTHKGGPYGVSRRLVLQGLFGHADTLDGGLWGEEPPSSKLIFIGHRSHDSHDSTPLAFNLLHLIPCVNTPINPTHHNACIDDDHRPTRWDRTLTLTLTLTLTGRLGGIEELLRDGPRSCLEPPNIDRAPDPPPPPPDMGSGRGSNFAQLKAGSMFGDDMW